MRHAIRGWLDRAGTDRLSLLVFAAAGLALVAGQWLLAVSTAGLTHKTAMTFAAVSPLILGIAVPAALGLAAAPRLAMVAPTRAALAILILAGIGMRAVWLGGPAPLEDDYYRYLWDGAITARGLDPYAYPPELLLAGEGAPAAYLALAAAAKPVLAGINFPEMRSIYPSVAQAGFALAHLIAPFKLDGLRIVLLAAELATLALLVMVLIATGRSPLWSALYWWNPLAAALLVGIVHVDALIPPLVIGALLAAHRGRPHLAVALIGLGAGVKIWPLVLAPIVLWPLLRTPRRLVSVGLVLAAVLALAVGPVVASSMRPGSGLTAYAAGWSIHNAFYAWAAYPLFLALGDYPMAERLVRAALALATAGIALGIGACGDGSLRSLVGRALVVSASVFYLSPAQFPWYAAWFLPLAALVPSWPLLLASATLPFYYLFYPLWQTGQGNTFFFGTAFIHAVPVLGWLLVEAVRARLAGTPATRVERQ